MIDELNTALVSYQAAWQAVVTARRDQTYFTALKPTAVCWKAIDMADFDARFKQLRDLSDQVHLGWVNERWLATFHLKELVLEQGISVIKLSQRRPGSQDAAGLDHVDFYAPQAAHAVLAAEPDLQWTEEHNGEICKWLSVWFAGTEAKLRTDSVLQVCAEEMLQTQCQIMY